MGDLKNQLLKARLISEEQAQAAKREQRSQKNKQGIRAAEQEAREKASTFRRTQQEIAEIDRDLARSRQLQEEQKFNEIRIRQIIESGRLRIGYSGPVKFYFVAADGTVPCLEVSSVAAEDLRVGRIAVVDLEDPGKHRYFLVPRGTADILLKEKPETIRFFNRNETS